MKKILVINFRYFGDALISASLSVRIRELLAGCTHHVSCV